MKVKNIRVGPGGANGPRVEIEWEALDKNLWREPIVLEYSETRTSDSWKAIHSGKLPNTGRYVWEVADKELWKFYVRVSALDMASNRGEHIYEKEVIVDLETPRAVIEKVQGSGDPVENSPRPAEKPRQPVETKPTPPPAKPKPIQGLPSSSPAAPPIPTLPAKK